MNTTFLDTLTGETRHVTGLDPYQVADGNWSCDCNRRSYFMEMDDGPCCEGAHRFIVTECSDPTYTLAGLNQDYPKELLRKHGIL